MFSLMKKQFLLVVYLLVCISGIAMAGAAPKNLLKNPGFEETREGSPAGWRFGTAANWMFGMRGIEGEVGIVGDIVHSGKKAGRLRSRKVLDERAGGSAGAYSDWITIPAGTSKITVSGWIKGKNIVKGPKHSWDMFLFTIQAYDKEKKKKIQQWDIAHREGTFGWQRVEKTLLLPSEAVNLKVVFYLTGSTGTAWFDDVAVTVAEKRVNLAKIVKRIDSQKAKEPVIIPHPWKITYGKGRLALTSLGIGIGKRDRDPALEEELTAFLTKRGIAYTQRDSFVGKKGSSCLLIIGDQKSKDIQTYLSELNRSVDWQTLGDQGYILAAGKTSKGNVIIIGSNGVRGRLYGFETLRQLIRNQGRAAYVPEVFIEDKPTLKWRGIAMGVQWFRQRKRAVKRIVALKGNFILAASGGWLNYKFNRDWRKPFTQKDKQTLKQFLELGRKYHVDIEISIASVGIVGSERQPPVEYSSEKEFAYLKDKMKTLYQLGLRNFGLNFDDWQRIGQGVLLYPEDKERFSSLGAAHYYWILKTYKYLKKLDKKNTLRIVPLWYFSLMNLNNKQEEYLKILGKLPRDIEFVFTDPTVEGVRKARTLTGRAPFIWDNGFAHWERVKAKPLILPPLDRPTVFNNKNIKGYIFLPMMPSQEDKVLVSWLSSFDYMWSPERYNPQRALENIVRRSFKSHAANLLKDYHDYTMSIRTYALPLTSKQKRITYIKTNISKLKEWKNRFKKNLDRQSFATVDKEINAFTANFQRILKMNKMRPFPVKVPQVKTDTITIDGKLNEAGWQSAEKLTGFYKIDDGSALHQTEARIIYDRNNLYLGIICFEPETEKLKADHKERDSDVFKDDSIEIFLDLNQDRESYDHIVINSIGTVYDSFDKEGFDIGYKSDRDWNAHYRVATSIAKNSWTVELAIPFKDLGVSKITKGERWNFNIARERWIEPREYTSYTGVFNVPNQFWTLEFE